MEDPCPATSVPTVADRLFAQLSTMIVTGELDAGTKISEPHLAARFGTSRAPLREAMHRLQERKLVTRIAHQGARVAVLSHKTIGEIFLVREALEGVAAREAAQRMDDGALGDLVTLLDVHEARMGGNEMYLQGEDDDDFHARIIRGSGNATLSQLLLDEYYLLIRMLRSRLIQGGSNGRRALLEHRRIAQALQERDGELAELLMRRHVSAAYDRIAAQLPPPVRRGRKETMTS